MSETIHTQSDNGRTGPTLELGPAASNEAKGKPSLRINTAKVIAHLEALPPDSQWTTLEIAEQMGVKECAVRAAVTWLTIKKRVESVGADSIQVVRKRGRWQSKEHYRRKIYRLREAPGRPADFALLGRVFGYGA